MSCKNRTLLVTFSCHEPWCFHCMYFCFILGSKWWIHVSLTVTIHNSREKYFWIFFMKSKILLRKLNPAQHFWNSARTDLWHVQMITEEALNRWFWHSAFSGNHRNFQMPVMHDQVFNFLVYFQRSQFHWPCRVGVIFNQFPITCELLWPIFHLVFRRCRITVHNQHPFTNNLCSIPFFWRNLMMDQCSNPTKPMLKHK